MKEYIEKFKQEELIKNNLYDKDLIILLWLYDFYFANEMYGEIINGSKYVRFSYQYLINDLPVIKMKNRESVAKRIKKHERAGIIEKKLVKNSEGTYTYFRILPKIEKWRR